jgi:hypothetical protein
LDEAIQVLVRLPWAAAVFKGTVGAYLRDYLARSLL